MAVVYTGMTINDQGAGGNFRNYFSPGTDSVYKNTQRVPLNIFSSGEGPPNFIYLFIFYFFDFLCPPPQIIKATTGGL